ncbi:lycopene cyclase domain-containing protein [Rathayibacter sp. PhB152]|uniref:lycopene cyclase domain-containing protein n=1 Tax=Rathayibacter sp. PhB152 TaxID=2485190 RepID=UPI000F4D294D|nr:lycopene cyclase domain-containing protein [Rathayibacter sp. PhB152]ROQ58973.1 lycopene cyclase domain-containing protein [Rathayibacter sp. PhB152]
MTYLALNTVFFLPIVAALLLACIHRRRALPSRRALAIALVLLIMDTAVFDNVLIAAGIVDYNPDLILGLRLWLAPIEDFAYSVGACLLLPALWALIPSRRDRNDHPTAAPPPLETGRRAPSNLTTSRTLRRRSS